MTVAYYITYVLLRSIGWPRPHLLRQGSASEAQQNWSFSGAFADLCGLDRTYLGGIERGERNVALVNLEKIAKALDLSLSELFRRV
ncbi:MAG TPA: helix-turn-helix transcriptional regulator [Candidatus Cybelea sp.]|nr:helix-turn-helix transcriptional regulator [Candidatus Cybelea sp.]